MRTASCNDLYAMEPTEIRTGTEGFSGCYFDHAPEIISFDLGDAPAERVAVKILKFVDFDGRRFWQLATVWFDDKPVMVIQNAGREGDDHARRFVTDWSQYRAMIGYLASLARYADPAIEAEVDPDEQRTDLLAFYGDHMDTVHLEVERRRIERAAFLRPGER